MNGRRGPIMSPGMARLVVIIALLVIWEVGARLYADPLFLCPPSQAVVALPRIFSDPKIIHAIWVTIYEVFVAFVLSVSFGMTIGLIVGLQGFTKKAILPVILLLYSIPQATVLPLFILSFGIGPAAKIAFGLSHGIFPVIVTTVGGVQNLRPSLLTAARSMGANRWQIFTSIVFPHMIPSFFTGMRLGMTLVLLGVLLAELYVSTAGIGFYTRLFAESFAPPDLFALIAVLAAIAVTLNEICRMGERRFSRWHNG
ncbi:MAG TPA: ABC transporter permease [Stellaceae bacterium]|jgi:ABC-type nitrate/sulfonate/bicarbonate transport system permease component|nr:ABC transporter permease [Stellaceae bacterium]